MLDRAHAGTDRSDDAVEPVCVRRDFQVISMCFLDDRL
jgi:hypothetical protein